MPSAVSHCLLQVANPREMPFTPLYLVSASEPVAYRRRLCRGVGTREEPSDNQAWTYIYIPGTEAIISLVQNPLLQHEGWVSEEVKHYFFCVTKNIVLHCSILM